MVKSSPTVKVIISVSKKISKKAVIRNRIRRRVRPIIREFISNLKPAIYFIVAKPGAEKVEGKSLVDELAELFKRV
ncbi:MAG: ribonuclease P protein component [Candidatus Zambryskibacteria bacterium RIFCSPHIGHO2_02_FULL_43_14]|uniref:Ribonuclease P protein component n=1 Tax=Candidatus Zambryskibacteria bacterium RIFCSPHIGHO2_02_FULL_43_14 TaxID=1802748 RepID=A0A1G2TI96_9BACT|nr:MAG: ribonuclease P protein component [Candidatus Zambryskibacteria bacterium RIFCSPHIGHO2_01_FULL_43_60]OHA97016.1 MAG: ribonuclease P protein component [Candidatus Zambryskibacteria bacterium RIFCSPHIGHO2_02_FULL_43_14]OHB03741.1 MAG: ribonuclease P protein component [Candidatus Zambryskibacteria bacterium RIFCSPLOWO2_01_FULL_42_41]